MLHTLLASTDTASGLWTTPPPVRPPRRDLTPHSRPTGRMPGPAGRAPAPPAARPAHRPHALPGGTARSPGVRIHPRGPRSLGVAPASGCLGPRGAPVLGRLPLPPVTGRLLSPSFRFRATSRNVRRSRSGHAANAAARPRPSGQAPDQARGTPPQGPPALRGAARSSQLSGTAGSEVLSGSGQHASMRGTRGRAHMRPGAACPATGVRSAHGGGPAHPHRRS